MAPFLVKYGTESVIWCTDCLRRTAMVPSAGLAEPSHGDVQRYKRIHVCDSPDGNWDIPAGGASVEDDLPCVT